MHTFFIQQKGINIMLVIREMNFTNACGGITPITEVIRVKKSDWEIVYKELYPTKAEAYAREREIKSWKSRKRIEQLIGSEYSA